MREHLHPGAPCQQTDCHCAGEPAWMASIDGGGNPGRKSRGLAS